MNGTTSEPKKVLSKGVSLDPAVKDWAEKKVKNDGEFVNLSPGLRSMAHL